MKSLEMPWAIIVAIILLLGSAILIGNNSNKDGTVSVNNTISQDKTTQQNTSCYSAEESWNHEGETGCVEFTVGDTYVSSGGNAYLNQYRDYTSGFSVWIPSDYSFGTDATYKYANKTIDVTGSITEYKGAPEIEVTSPSQIKVAQ